MKETNNPRKGEERSELKQKKRWRRNLDGTYRYVGICPFNKAVCRLINVFTKVKARQEEG
jgi:hypothetical protein